MRKVILESPYAAPKDISENLAKAYVKRNLRYARAAMRDCILTYGDSPFASHLLFTQDGVLDDDIPSERELGIEAGLEWGLEATATVVYGDIGISSGMQYGIDNAVRNGRPVEYRSIPGDWSLTDKDHIV